MSNKPARLKFDRIDQVVEGEKEHVEVTLSFAGRAVTGRSPSVELSESREGVRRTAMATLDAIQQFVDYEFKCELQEVDRVRALGKELVVLLINLDFEERHIQLFGSCRIGEDVLGATAKAALDATNRYIDIVLNRKPES
jgi:hypothetical protein